MDSLNPKSLRREAYLATRAFLISFVATSIIGVILILIGVPDEAVTWIGYVLVFVFLIPTFAIPYYRYKYRSPATPSDAQSPRQDESEIENVKTNGGALQRATFTIHSKSGMIEFAFEGSAGDVDTQLNQLTSELEQLLSQSEQTEQQAELIHLQSEIARRTDQLKTIVRDSLDESSVEIRSIQAG
jgi:predicted ATPase